MNEMIEESTNGQQHTKEKQNTGVNLNFNKQKKK